MMNSKELDKATEIFIKSMEWDKTPPAVRELVIGNIRGFRNFLSIHGEWKPNSTSKVLEKQ